MAKKKVSVKNKPPFKETLNWLFWYSCVGGFILICLILWIGHLNEEARASFEASYVDPLQGEMVSNRDRITVLENRFRRIPESQRWERVENSVLRRRKRN